MSRAKWTKLANPLNLGGILLSILMWNRLQRYKSLQRQSRWRACEYCIIQFNAVYSFVTFSKMKFQGNFQSIERLFSKLHSIFYYLISGWADDSDLGEGQIHERCHIYASMTTNWQSCGTRQHLRTVALKAGEFVIVGNETGSRYFTEWRKFIGCCLLGCENVRWRRLLSEIRRTNVI